MYLHLQWKFKLWSGIFSRGVKNLVPNVSITFWSKKKIYKLKSRIVTLKKWESQQGSIVVRSLNFLRAWKADSLRSLAKLSQRSWLSSDQEMMVTKLYIPSNKVENILKGSLDLIPSPSPSVKIQIMWGKVYLWCKGKTLLGIVNKLLKTKSFLTSPSNVLPYHLK